MPVPMRPGRPRKQPNHGASGFATVLPVVRTMISMIHSRQKPMALRTADHAPPEFGKVEVDFDPADCQAEAMTVASSWHFPRRRATAFGALCLWHQHQVIARATWFGRVRPVDGESRIDQIGVPIN